MHPIRLASCLVNLAKCAFSENLARQFVVVFDVKWFVLVATFSLQECRARHTASKASGGGG